MGDPATPVVMLMDHVEPAYGSDKCGLVWAYLLAPGQSAVELQSDAVQRWLVTLPQRPNEFLWLHLSLSNAAAERWMRSHLNLPEAFYQSCHEQISSTRVDQEDSALTAVIHDVLFDSTLDTSTVSTVNVCVGQQLLVSARLRPLRSVDRLRAAIRQGAIFQSSFELFSHLLRDQAGVFVDILRQSTIRVDEIEDKILESRTSVSRRELGALRRMLVRLQRLLAPEPAALFRLLRQPPAWIADGDAQDLRQAAEEFSAVVVDSVALVERVKLLQEELVALLNEQTNRTLFVLTLVTVMALPINLVAGLFGMNVGGIPLAQSSDGFWIVVATLAAVTGLLAYLVSRRKD